MTMLVFAVVCVVVVAVVCESVFVCGEDVRAHRVAQYTVSGQQFGCHAGNVSGKATRSLKGRGVLVVTWKEVLSIPSLNHISPSSVVVVLPTKEERKTTQWSELQRKLLDTHTNKAIYFVENTDTLQHIINTESDIFKRQTGSRAIAALLNGSFRMKVETHSLSDSHMDELTAPAMTVEFSGDNSGDNNDNTAKSIVVVVHYDSFSAVPDATTGDVSALAAATQLIKQLAVLYNDNDIVFKHTVKFVFVGGSPLGYSGAFSWLEDSDPLGADAVVCLGPLRRSGSGGADDLFVHVSKQPHEGDALAAFVVSLSRAASNNGMKTEFVHRKISRGAQVKGWPHEMLRLHPSRPPAFTLSTRAVAPKQGQPFPLLEDSSIVDIPLLTKTSQALLQTIVSFAADLNNADAALKTHLLQQCVVNEHSLKAFVDYFEMNTVTPLNKQLATNTLKDIAKTIASSSSVSVSFHSVDLSRSAISIFTPTTATLVISAAAGVSELIVFAAVVLSLALVYVIASAALSGKHQKNE
eukprot:m.43929 g.43929  ORF g.43929 m.43929 type:complete len:524 (+) comp10572_c0_seq1:47-1618(+)